MELIVRVININKGHNEDLARKSETLNGYETFVYKVRENEKTMSLEEAIKKAVVDCINQNVLKEFLTNHKSEVISMLLQEWTLEKEVEVTRKEAWEDGGEARAINIARKMKDDGMDVSTITRLTNLTIDEVLRL